jgi:hypothetical protein
MQQEQFLLASDAARIVQRTPAMVREYARTGKLAYSETLGGVRLFKRSDVVALAATLRDKAEASSSTNGLDVDSDRTPLLDRAGVRDAQDAVTETAPDSTHASDGRVPALPAGWALHSDMQPSR